jgi:ankyrin repeat protein
MTKRLFLSFVTVLALTACQTSQTSTVGPSNAATVDTANAMLWDAAMWGDIAAAEDALAQGADIMALDTRSNENGRRALNWAAWYDHPQMVRFLVDRGADINAANRTGFTPLHHAAENNAVDAAEALVALGANTRRRNRFEETPLDTAQQFGPGVVEVLRNASNAS